MSGEFNPNQDEIPIADEIQDLAEAPSPRAKAVTGNLNSKVKVLSLETGENLKAKVESVIFLSNKPVKAQTISRIVGADIQVVRKAILELIHNYEERDGGLEIVSDELGYSIQVK